MVIRGYGWLQVVMTDDGVVADGHGWLQVGWLWVVMGWLGTLSKKKNDIIREFFPTWGGGSSQIPKLL